MRKYLSIALLALFSLTASLAHAQEGFISSATSTVNCDASGNCGTISLTPAGDGYQYFYQATCLTTTPISPVNYDTVTNCNWSTTFYSSYDACDYGNATWGSSCPMTVEESGQPAGSYSIYLYIAYQYCPNAEYNATNQTCANFYQSGQQENVSGTVGTTGGGGSTSYSWSSGAWGTCTGGTQTRSVTCQDQNGNPVGSFYCTGTEPATSQTCSSGSTGPSCTSASCQAVNSGPGVTLTNCTPDASKGVFCVVVPTNPQ